MTCSFFSAPTESIPWISQLLSQIYLPFCSSGSPSHGFAKKGCFSLV